MLRSSISVLSFCLSSLLIATPASAQHLVTSRSWHRVEKVHRCESPTWHDNGPTYQGGLGWLHSTWTAYRAPWMPLNMARATPQEQAWAMVQFVQRTLHYWPHQGYPLTCGGGY